MRALVSGFEAFGGETVNASITAVSRLPARIGALEITTIELPTSFARAPAALAATIAHIDPDLVLCVGEAGERDVLSIERVAVNLCDARIADNDGARPAATAVIAGGPAVCFATLPVNAIVRALHSAGLPAEISNSAGTYVCNQVFYTLMQLAASAQHRWRGGFLHVPQAFDATARPLAKMRLDDIVHGIGVVLATAVSNSAPD
jgi:pyroglutamyl-peptidase